MKNVVNQLIKRRSFLITGAASFVSLPFLFRKNPALNIFACLPKQIKVPAAHMKQRADVVRADFVSKHLAGSSPQPYPFAKAFHTSSMLPTNEKIAERLLAKGDGFLRLNSQGTLVNGKINDQAIEAPFNAILCGKVFRLTATFPGLLEIRPTFTNDSLTLDIVSKDKILISFVDNLPDCGAGPTVSLKQNIDRLSVSTTAIRIDTSDYKKPDCKFALILDLTMSFDGPIRTAWQRIRSGLSKTLRLSALAVLVFFQLGSVCCGPNCPKPCSNNNANCAHDKCPPSRRLYACCGQQYNSANFPYVNMGNYAYSNACGVGPYNNTCSYENVTGAEKGCRLDPCAGQTVPTGWTIKGYKTELSRCSGDIYSNNVMIIEKF
jgi:hypothetical protein